MGLREQLMLEEARASVALDGETQSIEEAPRSKSRPVLFVMGPKHGEFIEVDDNVSMYSAFGAAQPGMLPQPILYRRVQLSSEDGVTQEIFVPQTAPEQLIQPALADALVRVHTGQGIDEIIADFLRGEPIGGESDSLRGRADGVERSRAHGGRGAFILPS